MAEQAARPGRDMNSVRTKGLYDVKISLIYADPGK